MVSSRRTTLRFAAISAAMLVVGPMRCVNFAQADISKVQIPSSPKHVSFRVMWKGEQIGYHNTVITPSTDGAGMTVQTKIGMKVKMGVITAFRYEHQSTETWQGGLLQSLVSMTNNDGDKLSVKGEATSNGFRVTGPKGPFVAPADSLTTNCMWLPELVEEKKLIDSQNGVLVGLVSKPLGEETVKVKGKNEPAERHSILTPFVGGSLWYDLAGNWVRSRLEIKGETLEYSLAA